MKATILFYFLFLSCCIANGQNDNPYQVFGHESKVVYKTDVTDYFTIPNADPNSEIKALAFDIKNGMLFFLGKEDIIIRSVRIEPDQLMRWLSTDPLANQYPSISPYAYVANNCINAIDPDGRKIIFVNGYYNTGNGFMPSSIANSQIGTASNQGYWGSDLLAGAQAFFGDKKMGFIDGSGSWNSSGSERFAAGYSYAKANLQTITDGMVAGETVKIVSQSMGSAYAEGMIKYLQEQKIPVEKVVHLSPADPSGFKASSALTLQLNLENDFVLLYKNFGENYMIPGVDRFGIVSTERSLGSDIQLSHRDTKIANVWNMVSDLQNMQLNLTDNSFSSPFGSFTGPSNSYNATGNSCGTQFNSLNIGGIQFKGTSTSNNFIGPLQY